MKFQLKILFAAIMISIVYLSLLFLIATLNSRKPVDWNFKPYQSSLERSIDEDYEEMKRTNYEGLTDEEIVRRSWNKVMKDHGRMDKIVIE
jgi:hypothetical protein